MNYFKRNPNALPLLVGTLIFIGLLVFAGIRQGTFEGKPEPTQEQPAARPVG
jgi:hypothetical protein